jgi:hypothetical protein
MASISRAFLGILIGLVQFANPSVMDLSLGGLIPMSGTSSAMQAERGAVVLPAIRMALEDINKRRDILAGYAFKLHLNNTKVFVFKICLRIITRHE